MKRLALSLTAALLSLAAGGTAQVIMRPPGQPPPTLPRAQDQVPRPPGFTDPDGPYALALRVYVTPFDAKRVLAPGQGVRLLLTDSTGRRFGRGPLGGAFFLEIPDATYEAVVNPNPNAPVGPRGRAGAGIALRRPPRRSAARQSEVPRDPACHLRRGRSDAGHAGTRAPGPPGRGPHARGDRHSRGALRLRDQLHGRPGLGGHSSGRDSDRSRRRPSLPARVRARREALGSPVRSLRGERASDLRVADRRLDAREPGPDHVSGGGLLRRDDRARELPGDAQRRRRGPAVPSQAGRARSGDAPAQTREERAGTLDSGADGRGRGRHRPRPFRARDGVSRGRPSRSAPGPGRIARPRADLRRARADAGPRRARRHARDALAAAPRPPVRIGHAVRAR